MKEINEIIDKLKRDPSQLGISLNPPATKQEIEQLENMLSIALPYDLKHFYQLCNGFETEDYIFQVIPIDEIIKYQNELKINEFHFAEYMLYSDSWNIRIMDSTSYTIFNDDHGYEKSLDFTDSITKFFNRYMDNNGLFGENGLVHWHDQIRNEIKYSPNNK